MAEVKKIATRESYGNALKELGARNPRVVAIDADLAGSTKTAVFRNAFPDRHFNCGIAECNVMGTAAGMAATGLIPYASTFAMFAEVLEEKCPVPIRRIGVQDKFGHSGAMKEVMEDFGLCASNIVKQTKDLKSKYRRFSRPTSTAMHKKASA